MIHRLLDAHEAVLTNVRRAIDRTEQGEDWGSNDLLMGTCFADTTCMSGSWSRTSPTSRLSPQPVTPSLGGKGSKRDHPASTARPAPDEGRATISKSSG